MAKFNYTVNLTEDIVIKMMKIKKMGSWLKWWKLGRWVDQIMIKFFFYMNTYIQTNRTKDYSHRVPFNIQETLGYNQKENVKKC